MATDRACLKGRGASPGHKSPLRERKALPQNKEIAISTGGKGAKMALHYASRMPISIYVYIKLN